MLTDAVAIGLALIALRLAQRPPGGGFTYGLRRAEILSAQVNGVTLLLLGALIVYEGDPPADRSARGRGRAGAGGGPGRDRGQPRRAAIDRAAPSAAASTSRAPSSTSSPICSPSSPPRSPGAVILATGFARADGIASLIVAALMLRAAFGLLRDSGRVFMEAAPRRGSTRERIGEALAASPGVVQVHDLHVWEVTTGMPAISAHLLVGQDADCHQARWRAARLLAERFGIEHSTLQVEHEHERRAAGDRDTRRRALSGGLERRVSDPVGDQDQQRPPRQAPGSRRSRRSCGCGQSAGAPAIAGSPETAEARIPTTIGPRTSSGRPSVIAP